MTDQEHKPTPEELKDLSIKMLETLLEKVKSGDTVIGTLNQSITCTRVYDKETDEWEHFRIGGGAMGWTYTCPPNEKEERERLKKFMADHPSAEIIDEGYPKKPEITSVPGSDPKDNILVLLNGHIIGYVVEADAIEGRVVQRIQGKEIRLKGLVQIYFNGREVPKVSAK